MGYDPVKVERTILEQIRQTHEGFSTVEDLIHDLDSGVFESDSDMCQESKFSMLLISVLSYVRYIDEGNQGVIISCGF